MLVHAKSENERVCSGDGVIWDHRGPQLRNHGRLRLKDGRENMEMTSPLTRLSTVSFSAEPKLEAVWSTKAPIQYKKPDSPALPTESVSRTRTTIRTCSSKSKCPSFNLLWQILLQLLNVLAWSPEPTSTGPQRHHMKRHYTSS